MRMYVRTTAPSTHHSHRRPSPVCPGPEENISHYYILTDTTDRANAEALGLNHSPKLAYSRGGATTAELDFDEVILVDRVGRVSATSLPAPGS